MASYLSNILLRANSGMAFYRDETTQSFRKMIEARRIDASFQIEINSYSELGKQIIQHYPGTVEIRGSIRRRMQPCKPRTWAPDHGIPWNRAG